MSRSTWPFDALAVLLRTLSAAADEAADDVIGGMDPEEALDPAQEAINNLRGLLADAGLADTDPPPPERSAPEPAPTAEARRALKARVDAGSDRAAVLVHERETGRPCVLILDRLCEVPHRRLRVPGATGGVRSTLISGLGPSGYTYKVTESGEVHRVSGSASWPIGDLFAVIDELGVS